MKPDYRVRMEIYDEETSEVISSFDQSLYESEDEIAAQAYTIQGKFLKAKQQYEEVNYPVNDEVDV